VWRPLKVGHQEHGCRPEGHPRHCVPMTSGMPPPVERVLMLPRCDAGSGKLTVVICMVPCTALARTSAVACRLRRQEAHYIWAYTHERPIRNSEQPALHGGACMCCRPVRAAQGGGGACTMSSSSLGHVFV